MLQIGIIWQFCYDLLVSCWTSVVCRVPKTEKTKGNVERKKNGS